jgi:prepilin-type N-terminal cleavage/methylation domain-containing protein/prepilin-type processing-associated H-X9-DG protein
MIRNLTPSINRHCQHSRQYHRAFTLIELLTVIAIIAILAAILIPVARRVRESARASVCVSNIRQVSIAMLLYADENNGILPTAGDFRRPPSRSDWILWRNTRGFQIEDSEIIPYLGGVFSPDVYRCPSDERISDPNQSYRYSYTLNRMLAEREGAPRETLDGRVGIVENPSTVILLVEEAEPNDSSAWLMSNDDFLTECHSNRGHVSFVDSHVELVYPEFIKYEGHWSPFPVRIPSYTGRR